MILLIVKTCCFRFKIFGGKHPCVSLMDHEGERMDGFESATKMMESNQSIYNQEDIEALKTFYEIQAGQLRLLRYSWNEDDKSVPEGWKSRCAGSKAFFLSPSGQQFTSRLAILLSILQEGGEEEEVDEVMKLVVEYEGWHRSKYLPDNWIFKVIWSFGAKDKEAGMNLRILSDEGHIMSSYSTAKAYIENSQRYNQEDLNNVDMLAKENAKSRRLLDTGGILDSKLEPTKRETFGNFKTVKAWEDAPNLPQGWKMKRNERPQYLSPDGCQFSGLPAVLRHLTREMVDCEEAEMVRCALIEEGWCKHELLPTGWMIKVAETKLKTGTRLRKTNLGIISPEGLLFSSFHSAACYMEERSAFYSLADAKNIKSIDLRYGGADFEEQDWGDDGSLPEGWKVKLSMEKGILCEAFITPSNKRLASRHTALEHLMSSGGTEEEVVMMRRGMKKFGWEEEVNLPTGWLKKEQGGLVISFLSPCNKKVEGLPALLDFLLTQKADFQVCM